MSTESELLQRVPDGLFIGGEWRPAEGGRTLDVFDPDLDDDGEANDVDLDIDAGRRVAVVGETGSGKSTVAKLLTRLMDPVEGAVLLDGIDVRRIQQVSLRRSVVLVGLCTPASRQAARSQNSERTAKNARK